MTRREVNDLLDKEATLKLEGFQVPVKILDARENYGRIDCLVTPVGGTGEAWVSAERVTLR